VALNCCPVNMSAAGFQPAVVRDCNLLKWRLLIICSGEVSGSLIAPRVLCVAR
jgi:hypothetical protein